MIKLGIVMDPIESINIKKDSSFAMMMEAQRRGWGNPLYGNERPLTGTRQGRCPYPCG